MLAKRSIVFAVVMVTLFLSAMARSALAVSSGEKVKGSGLIVKRDGGTLTVKTPSQGNIVDVVTEETKLGLFLTIKAKWIDPTASATNRQIARPISLR
jgi:hypothetical protein